MPDHETIRAFKAAHGEELRERYGAHAVGIGRRRVDGVKLDELALVLYVESRSDGRAREIPSHFTFHPDGGAPVEIPSTVVEQPRAREESPPPTGR